MFVVYLGLAVIGALLPLSQLVPWLAVHGFDMPLMVRELFANRIGGFFGLDVLVSAVVLLVFISREHVRLGWLAIVATFCIGVSCGLPLYLALRERMIRERAWT